MPKARYKQDKEGRWRTAIRTGKYDDQGKPILIRLSSSKSSADLEKKVQELQYQLRHNVPTVSAEVVTFGEYSQKWLATKEQRSIKTYEMYENVLKHTESLNDTPLDLIRTSDIQLLISNNSNHPRTCEQVLLTVRQIFDMAVDDDIITKSPCRNIQLPRHVKEEKRILTEEEREIVKKAEGLSDIQRAYIHILYGTGVRPAEACALTWNDIDFENNTITINKALQFTNSRIASVGLPKTDKSIRTLPVLPFVMASILALKATGVHSPTETILGAEKGVLRTRSAYRNIFDTAMKKLGLNDVTPYMFRHNFCSMCYFNKVDLKTCQALMGHADTKMVLSVYSHFENKDKALKAAIDKLEF